MPAAVKARESRAKPTKGPTAPRPKPSAEPQPTTAYQAVTTPAEHQEKSCGNQSLPVSRGSVVDSELSRLIHEFPEHTKGYLDDLFHVDTRRYKSDPEAQAALIAAKSKLPRGQVEQSHYTETYYQKPIRPRSNKRPALSPRDPNPPAMTFDTWQRASYPKPEAQERVAPIRIKDNYSLTHEPSNERTVYQSDYPAKSGERLFVNPPVPETNRRKGDNSTFYGATTSNEAFQSYHLPQRPQHYQDLPTFAGSIIYPARQQKLESTMQAAYLGRQTDRLPLFKGLDPTLRPEGEHDFLTTTRDVYRGHDVTTQRVKPVSQLANLRLDNKQPLHGETQFMHDFPGFKAGQPKPPNPILPAKGTIELRNDNTFSYDTEQRRIYQGHDVRSNPVPKPFIKDSRVYVAPTEIFSTQTITKADYQPIDMSKTLPVTSSKPVGDNHVIPGTNESQFYGVTTSQEFFKDWKPKPLIRHGDFHLSYSWVPPVQRLNGLSETKQTFTAPENPERVVSLKPIPKPVAGQGKQDFDTVYKRTYRPRDRNRVHLNHEQADILKRQLREKKVARLAATETHGGRQPIAVQ